jgi:hypothetical protein
VYFVRRHSLSVRRVQIGLNDLSRTSPHSISFGRRSMGVGEPANGGAGQTRLDELEDWLDAHDRLEAGSRQDLLMTSVLRHTELVSKWVALSAFQGCGEARLAFRKAMADHLKLFGTGGALAPLH